MTELSQVEENSEIARTAEPGSLTQDELHCVEKVKAIYRSRLKVNCTKCQYCMPCPEGVDIPGNLAAYNEFYLFDTDRHKMMAKMMYNTTLMPEARGDRCIECGACLKHCPQEIDIPGELKKEVDILSRN
jgi:uncharacterized protein